MQAQPGTAPAVSPEEDWAGRKFGLPAAGPGAVAGVGRRFLGLLADIVLSWLVAEFLTHRQAYGVPAPGAWSTLVFFVESVVLLTLTGSTAGMRLTGLRVLRLDGRRIAPWWATVRTVLLLAFVPALFWDSDHRGLHDRAAGVVVVQA